MHMQIAKTAESLELMSPRTKIVHGMSVRHINPRSGKVSSSSEDELEATPPTPSAGAAAASSYAEGDGYEDMEAAAF